MSRSNFVSMHDIAAAAKDADETLNVEFHIPHWGGMWEHEISDEELERLMADAELRNRIRGDLCAEKVG